MFKFIKKSNTYIHTKLIYIKMKLSQITFKNAAVFLFIKRCYLLIASHDMLYIKFSFSTPIIRGVIDLLKVKEMAVELTLLYKFC